MSTTTLVLSETDKNRLKVLAQRLGINTDVAGRYELQPKHEHFPYIANTAVFVSESDTWFVDLMERFFSITFRGVGSIEDRKYLGEYLHDGSEPTTI